MTHATKPELYPQYCFHLSPTINRWCHFRISDILALRSHPGFQGQDVYFHINHPIKWVRISGVVVAVDEREMRNLYTIDDGSGATLECLVKSAPRAAPGTAAAGAATDAKSSSNSNTQPVVDAPIDVGHVLDIKGSVGTFRDNKQIRAEKIVHLRSTEQEVVFWEKVAQLKQDVLSKPWVLDRREVRRCRKEEEGRWTSHRHRANSGRHSKKRVDVAGVEKSKAHSVKEPRTHHGEGERKSGQERKPLARRPFRETGLEKRRATKSVTRLIPVTGKYDALGL
ncbi:hypothetical protein N657DRAFT_566054 [Parathielavia appendiculata]|uniref:CST complex subunit STN1 n=1 Tax=Parathielavia appendiculata TaxID=2587402 RepID=A0AAN6U688_9PEZI|nr:hypothetical protein N657DRAFT_566054 [Parathielavia appendiculata]